MSSKGEMIVKSILENSSYGFIQEYSFPDLKSVKKKPLRFDFAVFKDGALFCLIEVQGEQHYEYIEHFSKTKQKWHMAQENDLRKCRYALMHNIPLYCIPFNVLNTLNNIEDIFNNAYLCTSKWHNFLNNPFKN